jgi:hypothetical protein
MVGNGKPQQRRARGLFACVLVVCALCMASDETPPLASPTEVAHRSVSVSESRFGRFMQTFSRRKESHSVSHTSPAQLIEDEQAQRRGSLYAKRSVLAAITSSPRSSVSTEYQHDSQTDSQAPQHFKLDAISMLKAKVS